MQDIFTVIDPILLISAVGGLFLFALAYFAYESFSDKKSRKGVKDRLSLSGETRLGVDASRGESVSEKPKRGLTSGVAKKANDFYANSDPSSVRKLQMKLIQAGYTNPGALGYFLAARVGTAIAGLLLGILTIIFVYVDYPMANKVCLVIFTSALGYFAPNFYLKQKIGNLETENRQGFPDVLDLMVVSAEAGLTMEASIERIAKEIQTTYPNLSLQLNLASLEIRAGRPLDQALRAFGERLSLEEVQGFATMVQQSKELGTSVSDALRVYSDEMRHKRMMKAEEKAYALPAKMSIPVTVFILPIVIGVAVIPTAVRLTMMN